MQQKHIHSVPAAKSMAQLPLISIHYRNIHVLRHIAQNDARDHIVLIA